MTPDEELAPLWYWLEDMCVEIPVPDCRWCKKPEKLVPPELLFYACENCFPKTHSWEFLNE